MNYDWSQTWDYVTIILNSDNVDEITFSSRKLYVKNGSNILQGTLEYAIQPDESTWYKDLSNGIITIELAKQDRNKHWDRLCVEFEPKQTFRHKKELSDYNDEEQQIFLKMRADQQQYIQNLSNNINLTN